MAKKEKKEKRFEEIYSQGFGTVTIYVDRETGVNYLCMNNAGGTGITPLLDREGKPVITTVVTTE